MSALGRNIDHLLSLPEAAARYFTESGGDIHGGKWFVASDPPGSRLGSGGGTAYLLDRAWNNSGNPSFSSWLSEGLKLIIHGSGQSRRLPAYAVGGKPLIPIPVLPHSIGQRIDQTLLDVQLPYYHTLAGLAPDCYALMVTSGDVMLRFDRPAGGLPEADVLILGMRVAPEVASHFGVCFTRRDKGTGLSFFLQKPSPDVIAGYSAQHDFLVDTGIWLLSERAVLMLMGMCGRDETTGEFTEGLPSPYGLYHEFGPAFGTNPSSPHDHVSMLTSAVVPLAEPEFYHLGTSRQIIDSVDTLKNRDYAYRISDGDSRCSGCIIQNAAFNPALRQANPHTVWVEGADIPDTWTIGSGHVITGIPDNTWRVELPDGICLNMTPVGDSLWCIQVYGIDDSQKGVPGDKSTQWLNRPATEWFEKRGIDRDGAGIGDEIDIYDAPLHPCLTFEEISGEFITWLGAEEPMDDGSHAKRWIDSHRISSGELLGAANMKRLFEHRNRLYGRTLSDLYRNRHTGIFYHLDLAHTAGILSGIDTLFPDDGEQSAAPPLVHIREHMLRSAVYHRTGDQRADTEEAHAFEVMRTAILEHLEDHMASPQCSLLPDQIVWARSPIRLDIAGGWTDTPPYCLQFGGRVTNFAANLNGQPPLQVYVKRADTSHIVIRSIDLGVEERINSYEEIDTYAMPSSGFAIAKAALALAGFLPCFCAGTTYGSLAEQLGDFGGGLEISLLAAIPQGSGLGTSSILAATILGALSDACALGWDDDTIIARTIALEQMMTTGGGWQDQAGGILRGVKYLETSPSLYQKMRVRWLPDYLFTDRLTSESMLLYYTGITRFAKNILQDIVRGMFLNESHRLSILRDIGDNAVFAAEALQKSSLNELAEAVQRSWELNQALDEGTNPPPVHELVARIEDYCAGMKLLGAGGGGYLLMIAKNADAAGRIRHILTEEPPNGRARFVDLAISSTGLEVTRS